MSAQRRLRAAVVGTGFVGPFHVDAVRRGGYADVVAIVGSDRGRTAARAAALGVERWSVDVREVLSDPTVDVVHVCTPNRTHVEIATAALEAGKHVVVEKPVALELGEARALAGLARRLGRHAAVAYTYRGYPMVRRARRLVADGHLGDLRLVHGAYIQDWLAEPTDYNWRVEPELSGASRAVADIGSHWFDTAEFITGLRAEAVLADLATFIPQRRRPTTATVAFGAPSGPSEPVDIRTEDAAAILVRFGGGARGACVVSQISPGRKNAFSLEIAGANRSLDWAQEDPEHLWLRDRAEARLLTRGLEDSPVEATRGVPSLPAGHPEGWAEAFRDLLRPFYAAIASGEPPPPSGSAPYPTLEDGARGIAFVEAVLESARSERWTPIADLS
jgi:predicted dehydrogenase